VPRLQALLAASGVAATSATLTCGVRSVHIAQSGAHRLTVGGVRLSYPAMNAAAGVLLALAVLGAAVVGVAARTAWRQVRATRALVRALPVVGPFERDAAVTVVDDATPHAFCAGYLLPRVYISTGAIALLSEAELAAVLAHERHHAASRDPLRLACGRVLSHALFFLPALRRLHERCRNLAELSADAAAVRAAGGARAPLASALLAFGSQEGEEVVGISPERVDWLLGEPAPWTPPGTLLAGALVTLAALAGLVWRASATASVHATLGLPLVSRQPCVLMLALLPLVACAAALAGRRTAMRAARIVCA
jgi:Zn-dependent protease with chaperone function